MSKPIIAPAVLIAAIVLPCLTIAQAGIFTVASVRPNVSDVEYAQSSERPDGVTLVNERLRDIIVLAFAIHDFQLIDAPHWIEDARFDVDARANRPLSMDEKRSGLRQLLAEEFALRIRTLSRQQQVYLLKRRGSGSGLKPRDCGVPGLAGLPCGQGVGAADAGIYRMAGVSTHDIAAFLSGAMGRLVIDESGLTGAFDVELRWRADIGLSPDLSDEAKARIEARPSLPVALREQLGLELQSARRPVSFYAIDRVARPAPK